MLHFLFLVLFVFFISYFSFAQIYYSFIYFISIFFNKTALALFSSPLSQIQLISVLTFINSFNFPWAISIIRFEIS